MALVAKLNRFSFNAGLEFCGLLSHSPWPSQRRHHQSSSPKPKRIYRYVIDVHGQLFLHDTVPKNMTSCFKSPQFLDFFFKRLKPNPALEEQNLSPSFTTSVSTFQQIESQTLSEQDWTKISSTASDQDVHSLALRHGYEWLSPCQGELNFIKALDTPVVFKELIGQSSAQQTPEEFERRNDSFQKEQAGLLKWGGTYQIEFQPEKLLVCKETGYLYHPSPEPSPLTSRRRKTHETLKASSSSPYGPYSLLSSSLVLSHLSKSLELDLEAESGSFVWKDQRYQIGVLERSKLFKS